MICQGREGWGFAHVSAGINDSHLIEASAEAAVLLIPPIPEL